MGYSAQPRIVLCGDEPAEGIANMTRSTFTVAFDDTHESATFTILVPKDASGQSDMDYAAERVRALAARIVVDLMA